MEDFKLVLSYQYMQILYAFLLLHIFLCCFFIQSLFSIAWPLTNTEFLFILFEDLHEKETPLIHSSLNVQFSFYSGADFTNQPTWFKNSSSYCNVQMNWLGIFGDSSYYYGRHFLQYFKIRLQFITYPMEKRRITKWMVNGI